MRARARSRTVERRLERALWSALFHRDGLGLEPLQPPFFLALFVLLSLHYRPILFLPVLGVPVAWRSRLALEKNQNIAMDHFAKRGGELTDEAVVASCRTWWTTFRPRGSHCGGS